MRYLSEHASAGSPRARRLALLLAAALVALAFARAGLFSSTGIRITGDGADYAAIAERMALDGRAPFVYRPAVPLLVGALFAGNVARGFAIVCAAALFAALLLAARLPRDPLAGYGLALLLFLNYQVLFNAANPGRLDAVVLALQLGFVALALRGRQAAFFVLMPLAALVKESLLPGLGLLVLAAFPRRRGTWVRAGLSAAAFVAVHLGVRFAAHPTAWMPPYAAGSLDPAAALALLRANLSPWLPLQLFVAWGGLCLVALACCVTGPRRRIDPLLAAASMALLALPLPLATDVNRAWFELLAPAALFALIRTGTATVRPLTLGLLAQGLLAGVVPYLVAFVAPDHLYLLILERRLTATAIAALTGCLVLSALALLAWRRLQAAAPVPEASPDL